MEPKTVSTNSIRAVLMWLALQCLFIVAVVAARSSLLPNSWTGNGDQDQIATLKVDAGDPGRLIPSTLFGVFFEEINHAGAGGLWAELVDNRGFEAGGPNVPSGIEPWYPLGKEDDIWLETDRSSPFERNRVALRVTVLCVSEGANRCPDGGVGVINPGFWGMDIRAGEKYRVTFWLQSTMAVNLVVKFISADEKNTLAQENLIIDAENSQDWEKYELVLEATDTDHQGKLALTSSEQGTFWLDQVSAFPVETYKGHGFRKDLALMLEGLKPAFVRFPGGCYVEGERLQNAWRWRESIGPWYERPGHFGDIWNYWSDDGLGYFEFLQLAEDLNSAPVWVFNMGIAHQNQISPDLIRPYVKDVLDGIEFARGSTSTKFGGLRAKMGHPEPFSLQHIAIGNEDCWKPYYRENYMAFYNAIKKNYADIKLISNCDATTQALDHPADLYDFHIYTNANNLFYMTHQFDHVNRAGPKVFVSEYAVTGSDSGHGSLLAALAEGAFMIGLEMNSDAVEMASYAPLFVHDMDRRWNPDAIVFNSWRVYGTPSYWVQRLFKDSSGAQLLPVSLKDDFSATPAVVSAVRRRDDDSGEESLIIKVVNFGQDVLALRIVVDGVPSDDIKFSNTTLATIASSHTWDENSFDDPEKVAPKITKLDLSGPDMHVVLPPSSIVAIDLKLTQERTTGYSSKFSRTSVGGSMARVG
ncbi:unnamed protein product [Calypogeia fissa]